MLICTTMCATQEPLGRIRIVGSDGDGGAMTVADFHSPAHFYLLTGFKSAEAFNAAQEDKPTSFILWERKH